jgi:hypothetical protein
MRYQDQYQKRNLMLSLSMIRIENLIHMIKMVFQTQLLLLLNRFLKSQVDGLKIKTLTKEYQNS